MSHIQSGQRGITRAIAHVQPAVLWTVVLIRPVGIRRSKTRQCCNWKTDATRPRVVAVKVHSFTKPKPSVQQKAVVALRPSIIELCDGSERLHIWGIWISQSQQPPGINVSRLRARAVSCESKLSCHTITGNEEAGIQFDGVPRVDQMCSDIGYGGKQTGSQLPLHGEIARILLGGFRTRWKRQETLIQGRRWKYRLAWVKVVGKWTPVRKWIVQANRRR